MKNLWVLYHWFDKRSTLKMSLWAPGNEGANLFLTTFWHFTDYTLIVTWWPAYITCKVCSRASEWMNERNSKNLRNFFFGSLGNYVAEKRKKGMKHILLTTFTDGSHHNREVFLFNFKAFWLYTWRWGSVYLPASLQTAARSAPTYPWAASASCVSSSGVAPHGIKLSCFCKMSARWAALGTPTCHHEIIKTTQSFSESNCGRTLEGIWGTPKPPTVTLHSYLRSMLSISSTIQVLGQ